MPPSNGSAESPPTSEQLKEDWLSRLAELVDSIDSWAREFGWSTRRIDKKMSDTQVGTYHAPALLLQQETVRVFLEPVARTTPGTEGVVDLYLMPAYDDIASLYYCDDQWQLQYAFAADDGIAKEREPDVLPVEKETLRRILAEMKWHAESIV
ncbi:MAG: hypothetical protein KY476_16565 [Planctomycetes bacterium]|nr:hypothetical protein [Planctomycetota bacterium]